MQNFDKRVVSLQLLSPQKELFEGNSENTKYNMYYKFNRKEKEKWKTKRRKTIKEVN